MAKQKWYQRLMPGIFSKKELILEGGFEVLQRLVGGDFTRGATMEQYRKSLYVFACISKIAEKVASVELKLYRILNSRGDTEEIITHPALDLLYKVNPYQTKTEFLETTMINLKTTGDAFWYKVRNDRGKVVELWNLRPDFMTIITDPVVFIKEYKFTKADGSIETFKPEDIIHFKYPDPLSQHLGLSPIRPAQVRVQTEDYATRYQRDFFLNSSRPDAVIKNPKQTLTKDQKDDIREGWEKRFKGPGKTHGVAILEGGMEYQTISLSQKEMDYIEGIKFTRDDILIAFKVPKPLLSIVEDVNRANSETAMFIFLSETIWPELVRLTEKINEEMIYPDFGDDFYIEAVNPTPANRELELKEYSEGLTSNYLLINEVRQREGLPPIKGGWSMYMSLINQAIGGLPQGEAKALMGKLFKDSDSNHQAIIAAAKPKQYSFKGRFWLKQKFVIYEGLKQSVGTALAAPRKAKKKTTAKKYVPIIKDAQLRKAYGGMIVKRMDAHAEKLKGAVSKFAREQEARVVKALDKLEDKALKNKVDVKITQIFKETKEAGLAAKFILPWLTDMLQQSGKDAIDMVAPAEEFSASTKTAQQFLQERADKFGKETTATTLDKLTRTLGEGVDAAEGIAALRTRVNGVFDEFSDYRSETIARTEATAANNSGSIEAFRQSDVATGKEWIATLDDRTRESHVDLDGELVGIDENFSNGLAYPGDFGDPGETINCRCVVGPAFLE